MEISSPARSYSTQRARNELRTRDRELTCLREVCGRLQTEAPACILKLALPNVSSVKGDGVLAEWALFALSECSAVLEVLN